MSSNEEQIRCMLLPLAEDYLLLPNVAVAEVIAYSEQEKDNSVEELVDFIDWRGVSVPIVSFEKASGLVSKKMTIGDRVAVLYHPDGDESKPYMGVRLSDIPKSFRAESEGLVNETISIEIKQYVIHELSDDGRRLFIPNLDVMFEQLV